MKAANEAVVSPSAEMKQPSPNGEKHARLKRQLVGALEAHLADTRPGEPRRNERIVSDAQLLLHRGDIPVDLTMPLTPGELIECVDLWRQELGTHPGPKRPRQLG